MTVESEESGPWSGPDRARRPHVCRAVLLVGCGVVAATLGFWVSVAHGQLSPGDLSTAHASLDSLFGCTSCHALTGDRTVMKCVDCHSEISSRIRSGKGYHARIAAPGTAGEVCATCHSEHNGRDFELLQWPDGIERFDHDETGYTLVGAHTQLECRQCHRAENIPTAGSAGIMMTDLERTFLGLDTACLSCHEDPHGGRLSNDCTSCHSEHAWAELSGFDHSQTRFALTGRHRTAACESCHRSEGGATRFSGNISLNCEGCHADPHAGGFEEECSSCHGTTDWQALATTSSFDHRLTPFPLEGGHTRVACDACHLDARFGAPVAHARCFDCHEDFHQGAFAERGDAGDCAECHTVNNFLPTTFVSDRHEETRYPLQGMHTQVSCDGCHRTVADRTEYHPASGVCMDCHDDAHDAQFAGTSDGGACESCHVVDGFAPSTFSLARHDETIFPLSGAHRAVPCFACHPSTPADSGSTTQFRFPDSTCTACHVDPHALPTALFLTLDPATGSCTACHDTSSWRSTGGFDHDETRFLLRGAHRTVSCDGCHEADTSEGDPALVFTGASAECLECHDDIHAGQFTTNVASGSCERCHGSVDWNILDFDHDRDSAFPLEGAHEAVECRFCHAPDPADGPNAVTRYAGTVQECAGCH